MKSLRRHEGYFLMDNRVNAGVSADLVRAVAPDLPSAAGRGLFEAPAITCSHCQTVVIIRPDRTRERAYCAKCDHYICDTCGVVMAQTKECNSFARLADAIQEQAALQEQATGIIVLP